MISKLNIPGLRRRPWDDVLVGSFAMTIVLGVVAAAQVLSAG
jgi:hypothetical protein